MGDKVQYRIELYWLFLNPLLSLCNKFLVTTTTASYPVTKHIEHVFSVNQYDIIFGPMHITQTSSSSSLVFYFLSLCLYKQTNQYIISHILWCVVLFLSKPSQFASFHSSFSSSVNSSLRMGHILTS